MCDICSRDLFLSGHVKRREREKPPCHLLGSLSLCVCGSVAPEEEEEGGRKICCRRVIHAVKGGKEGEKNWVWNSPQFCLFAENSCLIRAGIFKKKKTLANFVLVLATHSSPPLWYRAQAHEATVSANGGFSCLVCGWLICRSV